MTESWKAIIKIIEELSPSSIFAYVLCVNKSTEVYCGFRVVENSTRYFLFEHRK